MNELTHLDLFSGIGGFKLAAQWAGFRTVGFSEVEPYACCVLAERWPDVPNIGDVRITANFSRFRGCTLLTGGFPCQPWSLAGKRMGANDDRHLWPAMLAVIEAVRPAWIIGENVPGLIGLALDNVCAELEARGYAVQPFVVPACAVDAKHRRDRVWIVANHDRGFGNSSWPRETQTGPTNVALSESESPGGALADSESIGSRGIGGRNAQGFSWPRCGRESAASLANASSTGRQERDTSAFAGSTRHYSGGDDPQRGYWLSEPSVGRVADGIPNRAHRLKGLGNAIVPQVAYRFTRWIAQIERGEMTD
mgnify:FL=1